VGIYFTAKAFACGDQLAENDKKIVLEQEISGEVVDDNGNPISNAEVFWATCGNPKTGCPYTDHWSMEFARKRNEIRVDPVRSNTDGKFRIHVPAVDKTAYVPDRLWAFAPGYCAAVATIPDSSANQSAIRLVLNPPSRFRVKVLQPDGKPIPGATVSVTALGIETERCSILEGELFFPPDDLVAQTAVTTDEQGVAVMPAWRAGDVLRVDITTPAFGHQTCYSRWVVPKRPSEWEVKLMSVGKLQGRVVADGPYSVQGLNVHVKTMSHPASRSYAVLEYINSPPVPSFQSSEATVTTDSEGRFEIPVIAHGWIDFKIDGGLNRPYQYVESDYWKDEKPPEFRQGGTSPIEFRLRKAVHVHGKLMVHGSNERPSQFRIACAETHKSDWFDSDIAFLVDVDDKGNFDYFSLPGIQRISVRTRNNPILDFMPLDRVDKLDLVKDVKETSDVSLNYLPGWRLEIPQNVEKWNCIPIEISQVHGRVVAEGGNPLSKAKILVDGNGVGMTLNNALTYKYRSDEQGRFKVWIGRVPFWADGIQHYYCYGFGFAADDETLKARVVQWDTEEHPNGEMGDIILSRSKNEDKK
jgi:hypothetical protein